MTVPAPNGPATTGCAPTPVPTPTGSHPILLNPLAQIFFSCFSNAAISQRITITVDGKEVAVFEGHGENTPMKLKGSVDSKVFELDYSFDWRNCVAKFQYLKGNDPQVSQVVPKIDVGDKFIRSISINSSEDGSQKDDNDSQLKVDMVFISRTNPACIKIPKGMRAQVTCMANSSTVQNVSWWVGETPTSFKGVFTGSGENKAMVLKEKGASIFTIDQDPEDRQLYAVFSNGTGTGRKTSKVKEHVEVGNHMRLFTTVGSEDSKVKGEHTDDNDAVLRVVAVSTKYDDDD